MPATATLNRPNFTDVDSVTAARFNSVTILSVIVPDATNAAEGVLRIAGDLTGTASSPQLVTSGVTAGTYGTAAKVPRLTVDAKGRVTGVTEENIPGQPDATAGAKGLIQLAGDLTGTATSPTLVTSGVTAGTYGTSTKVSRITVDAKGRVTAVTEENLPDAAAGSKGMIQLAGDLTGTAASPVLATSGVAAGTYGDASKVARVTVDAKGRVTGVTEVAIPAPAGLPSAWVQFDGNATTAYRVCAYARASNVVTVTDPGHTWRVGDRVSCDVTTGGLIDGLYTVETVSANEWTFTLAGANTGGNVTLEVFQTRNTRNVHSVVKDRRFTAASYWVNFQTALANDTYLVLATGEHYVGSWNSVLELNAPGGVRAQDTRGFSIRSFEPGASGAWVANGSIVIFGG